MQVIRNRQIVEDDRTFTTPLDRSLDLGAVQINISGCVNACGHHHVGHIGVLGVDKRGSEFYQLMLGGRRGDGAALARIVGRAFDAESIVDAVCTVLRTYARVRSSAAEVFIETVARVGLGPFQRALYGAGTQAVALGRP